MADPVPTRPAKVLAAEAYVDLRELVDRQLSPLGLRAIEALAPRPGDVILDVGCGTGQTALQLAEMVGHNGRVIGIDIAPLVLAAARERIRGVENVSFIEGDAALLDLPEQSIDGVFSRFGVMAFPEPVAAFSNFHRLLKSTGRLAFVCWRSLEENELDLLPLQAAGLEQLVDRTPFSFEDPGLLRALLEEAGFNEVSIHTDDQTVTSGDLDAMATVLLRIGPLGRILRENAGLQRDAAPRVRAALVARGNTAQISLQAATWIVSARA